MAKKTPPNDGSFTVPGETPSIRGDGGDPSARPLTDTSPGSAAYALKGPLAATVAPLRVRQGESAGAVPPKSSRWAAANRTGTVPSRSDDHTGRVARARSIASTKWVGDEDFETKSAAPASRTRASMSGFSSPVKKMIGKV